MGKKAKAEAKPEKKKEAGKAAAPDLAAPEQPAGDKKAAKGKRAKDEIDDIFSRKPAKKAATEKADGGAAAAEGGGGGEDAAALSELAAQVKAARDKNKGDKPKVEGSKDDIFGESSGKSRKRTEEGFAIYTEDELGFGKKGGDTDKCPFECDCCF